MKTPISILFLLVTVTGSAQVQPGSANPFSDGARVNYSLIKSIVSGAAAAMPESDYSFRPTAGADVRTFGQFVGHLADANYRMCSIVMGQDPPMETGLERSATTKGELIKALAESFTYCDKVYADMSDAAGAALVKFDAGGEGTRQTSFTVPKITAMGFHVQHAFEHYGNLVTYMRMKAVIPPTSTLRPVHQPAPAKPSPSGYKDVSGDWNLIVQTPDGPVKATLTIAINGSSVSADADSERGLVKLTGTLTAAEIRLSGLLQTLPVTLIGKPGPRSMDGQADFGGRAMGTWTASRPD